MPVDWMGVDVLPVWLHGSTGWLEYDNIEGRLMIRSEVQIHVGRDLMAINAPQSKTSAAFRPATAHVPVVPQHWVSKAFKWCTCALFRLYDIFRDSF